jgi:hypothetical protein
MTERETYQMFLALYERLYEQQQIVDETAIVVQAMYRSLCDLLPDFRDRKSKHHQQLADGDEGRVNAASLQILADIIQELKKVT